MTRERENVNLKGDPGVICAAIISLHIRIYVLVAHVVIFMYNLSVLNKLKT